MNDTTKIELNLAKRYEDAEKAVRNAELLLESFRRFNYPAFESESARRLEEMKRSLASGNPSQSLINYASNLESLCGELFGELENLDIKIEDALSQVSKLPARIENELATMQHLRGLNGTTSLNSLEEKALKLKSRAERATPHLKSFLGATPTLVSRMSTLSSYKNALESIKD